MSTVVVVTQERIEQYADTARKFFREVLNCDYDNCLVTDLSELRDFSPCALPDDYVDNSETILDFYNAADAYAITAVKEHYGIELVDAFIKLVDLFEMIEQRVREQIH